MTLLLPLPYVQTSLIRAGSVVVVLLAAARSALTSPVVTSQMPYFSLTESVAFNVISYANSARM